MGNWIKSAVLIKTIGCSKATIGDKFARSNGTIPWIRKAETGRGYEIDISSPLYTEWSNSYQQKKTKKNTAVEKKESSSELKNDANESIILPKSEIHVFDSEEDQKHYQNIQKLKKESEIALLSIPLKDLEKKELDIQMKNIDYLKKSKKTKDLSLTEFCYLSYLDKLNVMLINAPKKIRDDIENEIKREFVRNINIQKIEDPNIKEAVQNIFNSIDVRMFSLNIINCLVRKQETIIVDIKKQQISELKSLEEENEK